MEVEGKIKLIKEEQAVSASFKKRELVIVTDEQYPQSLMIEFVQDKTSLLDQYSVGDAVKVSINLKGREWTNPQGEVKYFNSIQGWRVEKLGSEAVPVPSPQAEVAQTPVPTELAGEDDLPF